MTEYPVETVNGQLYCVESYSDEIIQEERSNAPVIVFTVFIVLGMVLAITLHFVQRGSDVRSLLAIGAGPALVHLFMMSHHASAWKGLFNRANWRGAKVVIPRTTEKTFEVAVTISRTAGSQQFDSGGAVWLNDNALSFDGGNVAFSLSRLDIESVKLKRQKVTVASRQFGQIRIALSELNVDNCQRAAELFEQLSALSANSSSVSVLPPQRKPESGTFWDHQEMSLFIWLPLTAMLLLGYNKDILRGRAVFSWQELWFNLAWGLATMVIVEAFFITRSWMVRQRLIAAGFDVPPFFAPKSSCQW